TVGSLLAPSEGFNQIIDFLNRSSVKYALTVNPNIYVSCIKQFWTTVAIKKVNDVIRLQALVDKKKVVASVLIKKSNDVVKLQALIDRKKVIITKDTIRQALLLDDADAGLSSQNTKYTSPALTQKVFANMRRIVEEDKDNKVSVVPTLSSPTPATTPPPPQQEPISSPPQAQSAQPLSPPQQQPSQIADISKSSMTLLNKLMETCATLTQKVANLEQDKIAQALEIIKLKQMVKKLEKKRGFKSSGLKRRMHPNKGEIAELAANKDFTLVDVDAEVEMDANVVTTAAPITTVAQVLKANALRRRRGVIIQDPEETAASVVKPT
nr:hypothetical protein [Tanacetum cinerariifolium]